MGMLQQRDQALETLATFSRTFAVIDNPPGVFPPKELVPLGPVHSTLKEMPAAIFLDMDGTITCTEPLFLHGVEAVVRQGTGWHDRSQWAGLDPARDYPKIVGFNTLRNLEYLFTLHGDQLKTSLFLDAFLEAVLFLHDHEVPLDIHQRLGDLLAAYGLDDWDAYGRTPGRTLEPGEALKTTCAARFPTIGQEMFSQFGLVIFYANYLEALDRVNRGEGARVSEVLFGDPTIPAVAPMPGIALLCALVKGWIPAGMAAPLAARYGRGHEDAVVLARLCQQFEDHPVPLALVTSSGAHETQKVLNAVFAAMREEVLGWHLSEPCQARILAGFAAPPSCFDCLVTCDDVIDGRTKPFRDPYTTALQRLGLTGDDAGRVIGFEDTEVGIIAQRGAGVGVPCAVPIEFTEGQDFSAAAHVLPGGVRQAIFDHGMFLQGVVAQAETSP